MAWCPRQMPSSGMVAAQARTMSMLAPASAGVPGPGEMTMPAGPEPATSPAQISSADHLDLASLPEQQMGQVIGERVVVVDQDDYRAVPAVPAPGNPAWPAGRHWPGYRG